MYQFGKYVPGVGPQLKTIDLCRICVGARFCQPGPRPHAKLLTKVPVWKNTWLASGPAGDYKLYADLHGSSLLPARPQAWPKILDQGASLEKYVAGVGPNRELFIFKKFVRKLAFASQVPGLIQKLLVEAPV